MTGETGRAEVLAALDVSRETSERLDTFVALLRKWNSSINLVSRTTLDEVWTRHILDSAQLWEVAGTPRTEWLDLGTGGGFPGLVIAILAQEDHHLVSVTCVEADVRKASFLRTTANTVGVPLKVLSRRIEDIPEQNADIISARALASLDALLALSARHLAPRGHCLFPKGKSWQEEVDQARKNWQFNLETIPSRVSPDSVVLRIGEIERV